ncbi:hypothetical protein SALBM135S_05739 [Streptomyces alboniger]
MFAAFYVPLLATFVALMLTADDGPAGARVPAPDRGQRRRGVRDRLALRQSQAGARISPGKTRKGLVGAVAFAMAAGALCMEFLIDGGSWWQGLLIGLAVAASATLGDLGEWIDQARPRDQGHGHAAPGHGGIMDRFLDSLLPTAPVAGSCWYRLRGGIGCNPTGQTGRAYRADLRKKTEGRVVHRAAGPSSYVCDTGRTMPKPGELTFVAPRGAKKPPRHLADLTPAERKEAVAATGEKPFRAKQLSQHYFARYAHDPAEWTNSPPARARSSGKRCCPT